MWVLTTDGFYSAVASRTDPDVIVVRARRKGDLDRLAARIGGPLTPAEALPRPVRDAGTDYPWRLFLARLEWQSAVADLAAEIDYPNFKDAVAARRGRKVHDVYLRVWAALIGLERRRARPLPVAAEDFVPAGWTADDDPDIPF